ATPPLYCSDKRPQLILDTEPSGGSVPADRVEVGEICTHIAQVAAWSKRRLPNQGRGGNRPANLNSLCAGDNLSAHSSAHIRPPSPCRDQMSCLANVITCQPPPGREFC